MHASGENAVVSLKYETQQMLKQGGGGAIVNMSSVAGLIASPGAGVYIASMHDVLGLSKTAAAECAKQGIRVNAVCPAVIQTDMADRAFSEPEIKGLIRALHPIGRFGTPREVSEAVLWLCSDKSSFTTGQYVGIDGGLLIGPNPFA
jgi:NAD(P)-dependent dehydrogenase (short-subunit alcohol dehydrogenase family)